MSKYAIVQIEDWTGLYIDDKLVDQDHDFTFREVIAKFNLPVDVYNGDDLKVMANGGFPSELSEVIR